MTWLLAFLLSLAVASQGAGPAPPAPYVDFSVEDERGTPILDLKPGEIQAFIGAQPVAIASLSTERPPMSIVVLIDVSRSTRWNPKMIAADLAPFMDALTPRDRVSIRGFGDRVLEASFAPPPANVRQPVERVFDVPDEQKRGPSPIWDVLHDTVTSLSTQPAPRAVLLFTDGRATGNRHGLADVAEHLASQGVSLHVLNRFTVEEIPQGGTTAARVQPGVHLERMAVYSGGQYFVYPERQPDALRLLLTFTASRLRPSFRVTLPALPRGTHPLELRIARQGVKARAPMVLTVR